MKGCIFIIFLILLTTTGCGLTKTDEIAEYLEPNSYLSVVLLRHSKHLFLSEYERSLIIWDQGKIITRRELSPDTGGYSRANLFFLAHKKLLVKDAFGAYEIDLKEYQITERDQTINTGNDGTYLGTFAADEKKQWRYFSAAERKYEPLELKGG